MEDISEKRKALQEELRVIGGKRRETIMRIRTAGRAPAAPEDDADRVESPRGGRVRRDVRDRAGGRDEVQRYRPGMRRGRDEEGDRFGARRGRFGGGGRDERAAKRRVVTTSSGRRRVVGNEEEETGEGKDQEGEEAEEKPKPKVRERPRVVKPVIKTDAKTTARNKRFLGSLLGQLTRAKTRIAKDKTSDVVKKKLEVDAKISEKVDTEMSKLREDRLAEVAAAKAEEYKVKEKLERESNKKRLLLLDLTLQEHQASLSGFLYTTRAKPPLFWMPVHHTEGSEKLLETLKKMDTQKLQEITEKVPKGGLAMVASLDEEEKALLEDRVEQEEPAATEESGEEAAAAKEEDKGKDEEPADEKMDNKADAEKEQEKDGAGDDEASPAKEAEAETGAKGDKE